MITLSLHDRRLSSSLSCDGHDLVLFCAGTGIHCLHQQHQVQDGAHENDSQWRHTGLLSASRHSS